jgi:hypothetical protein
MDFSNNRNTMILAFILMLLGAVALLESSALVVLILLGLLFLVRQFDNNQLSNTFNTTAYEDEYELDNDEWEEVRQTTRQVQSEPVYRHALEAVTRAGLNPDEIQVLPVDIGIMAFRDSQEPTVYRTWSIPDDVDYVQPFVQLRLPSKANGRIRFEILDGAGAPVFIHEDIHKLERGRNFISPASRLPIHDQREMDKGWQLRISADGVVLAMHKFEFAESSNAEIQRHIGEDGEINTELRAVMTESRLQRMSLDDLLSYQEDEESGKQSR